MDTVHLNIHLKDPEYAVRVQRMIQHHDTSILVCLPGKGEEDSVRSDELWLTDDIETAIMHEKNAMLMMDPEEADRLGWKGERLDPYSPGHRMIKQLKACIQNMEHTMGGSNESLPVSPLAADEESTARSSNRSRKGMLISVYSPIGGCGKSTLAMTVSEVLAAMCTTKRVLYFNLEGAADWRVFFKSQSPYTVSDFIYSMLLEGLNEEEAVYCMERILTRQESGVYFMEPCDVFEDLNVLEESEIDELIDSLCSSFDYVICDMNTAYYSINQQFLRRSTYRYFIMNTSMSGQAKMQSYMEGLRQQHMEEVVMGAGVRLIKLGTGVFKMKWPNMQYTELPMCHDLYQERDGQWELKKSTEWYRQVRKLTEEVLGGAG